MEKKVLKDANILLRDLKTMQTKRVNRLKEINGYSDMILKQGACNNGTVYYNVKRPGDKSFKYLGDQTNMTVRKIQEARFLRKSLEVLQRDIDLLEDFLAKYELVDFEHISSRLPKIYRNSRAEKNTAPDKRAQEWKTRKEKYKAGFPPYRPEELKVWTIDRKLVRSKSEALIYNYLFEAGYTFVYELPLEATTRTFYPDFTILSEIDFRTEIRIEHQGKMGEDIYKNHAEARAYDYWLNGYLPGRDVYFTYDDNKGGFDIGPIIEILISRVRPENDIGKERDQRYQKSTSKGSKI